MTIQTDTQKPLGARFNDLALRLCPEWCYDDGLLIDPSLSNGSHIDEIVHRRSEALGRAAAVILSILRMEDQA